jgi:branched-chain amino acid transport system ATP-binding protein
MNRLTGNRPCLSAQGVEVRFGGLVAIADLTFDVREGEILSLIGPNGAGKTTAFNVITGYMAPTAGRVRYRGTSLAGLTPNKVAEMGLVRTFQRTSVFANCSLLDNLLIGQHLSAKRSLWEVLLAAPSVEREEAKLRDEAMRILDFVGLAHRSDEPGGALPYGEQRLLEVATALAAKPSLLLLDEPASGMNPTETSNFMKLVERIRQQGVTILLVEHDMRLVMNVSDRVIVLNQGRLIADGTPEEVQRNETVMQAYLSSGTARA